MTMMFFKLRTSRLKMCSQLMIRKQLLTTFISIHTIELHKLDIPIQLVPLYFPLLLDIKLSTLVVTSTISGQTICTINMVTIGDHHSHPTIYLVFTEPADWFYFSLLLFHFNHYIYIILVDVVLYILFLSGYSK